MRKFRILALMLVLIMVLAGCGTGNSTPAAKDIVILYTNDAHCGIEDGMGYQGLSAAKRALLAAGNKVLLVDNGDAVQGDTIGTPLEAMAWWRESCSFCEECRPGSSATHITIPPFTPV